MAQEQSERSMKHKGKKQKADSKEHELATSYTIIVLPKLNHASLEATALCFSALCIENDAFY